eukprot:TRINITY_DN29490_c0_g2_i1.p1 TRINITY_DN29490_c0_g2~~TRINITY_DN29490_c0_g2_i1.p1  ORF type:complete len:265 (+),score=47.09 TRINITY_DN29490_c0_g2_i1:84-878(+)
MEHTQALMEAMLGGPTEKAPIASAQWTPDNHASHCMLPSCGARFNVVRRRHHCRQCGQVFCWRCAPEPASPFVPRRCLQCAGATRCAPSGDSGLPQSATATAPASAVPASDDAHIDAVGSELGLSHLPDDGQEAVDNDVDDLEYVMLDLAKVLPKSSWDKLSEVLRSRESKAMDMSVENAELRKEVSALRSAMCSNGHEDTSTTSDATQFFQMDAADEPEYTVVETPPEGYGDVSIDGAKSTRFADLRMVAVMFPVLFALGVLM